MGIVHQQRQIRERTIDARPNEPSEVAFADGLARLEVRVVRLEALVTQLSRDATVTHNAEAVTPVTPDDRNAITEPVTARNAYRNAERQRRYRERKKAHGADPQR